MREVPFLATIGGRVAIVVAALVVLALALFVYDLSALGALRAQAPAAAEEIAELELLQWVFAAGATGMGGLILYWVRALIAEESRAARDARLRAIVDSTSDGIITIDERGIVLDVNRAAEDLFGYSEAELVGRNVSLLMGSPHRERHDAHLERYLRTGEARIIGRERHLEGMHKDGHALPIALRVTELRTSGAARSFVAIVHDRRTEAARERLIESARDVLSEIIGSAGELFSVATQQASAAEQQAASVAQTVVTVEEVSQTAVQAAERAKAVAESSRRVEELGHAGHTSVHDTVHAIEEAKARGESIARNVLELAERAQTIGQIIASVDEIAEQTHLLALNAAIEASRAGEHGRGFSVVAAEVKALARRSKEATVQVREMLGEIQRGTSSAVLAGEQGDKTMREAVRRASEAGEAIDALTAMIARAADAAAQISASAGQQATGMSQINQAMKDVESALRDNLGSIKNIEREAASLNALSERIGALVAEHGNGA